MKLIKAIIRIVKLNEVKTALSRMGIRDLSESAIIARGQKKGQAIVGRGAEILFNFAERVKLEIVVADEMVGKVVDIVGNIARTERMGDCRFYILPLVEVL